MTQKSSRSDGNGRRPLDGATIFIPPMVHSGASLLAAVCRSLGIRAELTPPSDLRTLDLGGRYTSGDECFPARVTVGDFFRVLERPGIDTSRTILFMPTADGPCRFGQYAPFLRRLLDNKGFEDVRVLSPTTENTYGDLGALGPAFMRTAWRAVILGDILERLLLCYRPRERRAGDAQAAYEESLADLCAVIETAPGAPRSQLGALRDSLFRCRDRFRSIRLIDDCRLSLVGVVGEIFCRLHSFSNQDLIRRIEALGAEVWLSGVTEWMWYTLDEELQRFRLTGRRFSPAATATRIRGLVQRRDEHALMGPFHEEFAGREEPDVRELLENARAFLPREGVLGEMVLSVGKAVYLARKGAAGIIDISPFTCMNGIVAEALYPRVSEELGGIPIRNFYFDGTQFDLDGDLDLFMLLARSYQKRALKD
jgi:predicted nucleotide-binding protein (sugar kinase/HSP70/actin superfamily)